MSLFEGFLIYAVSWWLVLFMVLPWGVRVPQQPVMGHAPSAPDRPNLRKKLLITSLLSLLVPLAVWGVSEARATPAGMYHAGSNDCAEPADVVADPSINAQDTDATIGGPSTAFEHVPTMLDGPAQNYNDNAQAQQFYGGGIVQMGAVETNTRTGEVRLNGERVGSSAMNTKPSHCQ
jgi:predicted secreted protein